MQRFDTNSKRIQRIGSMRNLRPLYSSIVGTLTASLLGQVAAQPAMPMTVEEKLDRIIVTGSQIPRAEKETPSPVQVISAENLKMSGYTSVSEVLRDITANGQGTLNQSFNGAFAAGASGVSLRGLTVGATLVLIDGHRMAPYPLSDDGQRPFVDVSSIPFDAVERIEILKDGASAVYGSDAIAGVINVILKKSFIGTVIGGETGTTQHGGGSTSRASLTHGFGASGDSISGFISLEYRKQDQIKLSQRSGAWTNFDWTSQGGENLNPGARNALVGSPRLLSPYLQAPGTSTSNAANFAFYSGCTYAQMRASQCTFTNTWAQLQPSSQNINLLGSLTSQLLSGWELNVKASHFDSKNQQTGASGAIPFGSFGGITATGAGVVPTIVGAIPVFNVPANYPGNTLGIAANVRAFVTPGQARVTDVDSQSTRLVAELTGSFAEWEIKGAAGYTRVVTNLKYKNFVNNDALYLALNSADPNTRFNLVGANSDAVIALVTPQVSNKATDELDFLEVRASRDWIKLAGGPVGLGVGMSVVRKSLNALDPIQNQQGIMNLNGAYAIGKERNTSAYAEVILPALKSLEIDAAIRFDHYDTYGNSTTPKVGFKFTPMAAFTLRGTASKGFRAPSATENGSAGSLFAFNAIRDPALCPVLLASGKPDLTNAANIPAACNFNPTYLQGTNKDLQPEKSKSYTFGLIFEPIKNWSTTLDFYQISVNNQIIPAAALATFNPLLYIVRGSPQTVAFGDGSTGTSSVGPIAYVNTPYVNGQLTETNGLEFETRYQFNLAAYGKLNVGAQWTHMLNYDQTINGVTYKLAGTHGPSIIGGDTGNPRDRMQFTLAWDQGPLSLTSTTNFIGRYDVTDPSQGLDDCASSITAYNSQFVTTDPPGQYCKVHSFVYTNLSARYKLDKAWTFNFSVTNLFDKQPPIDLQTYGGTGSNASSNGTGTPYNPSLHQIGAVGRFFSLGVNYKF